MRSETSGMGALQGLTAAEVAERGRRGQVNRLPSSELRDYAQIVARNLVTWFNAMVAPAALALFYLDEFQAALAVSGMAIVNTALGLAQEIRGKRHLDKLAILVETKARVLRDGLVQEIPAGQVVLGEHLLLAAGETVVADGPVLQSSFLEIDEALLTGESDPVRRAAGDALLSGSFCVAGEGAYRADKVGPEAFANRTSAQARKYHAAASPLTRVINTLVQVLSYIAIGLILLYTVAYLLQGFPKTPGEDKDFVRMIAATITSMVPQGMVLTATIAFTLGAIHMSRRGAVVQRLNAVETMAAVDVICTDKTGTLTTNHLRLDRIIILDSSPGEEAIRQDLRAFASATIDRRNKNIQAIHTALGDTPVELLDQIPFKSQNRYSAVRIRGSQSSAPDLQSGACQEAEERVLILGGPEALQERIALGNEKPSLLENLNQQIGQLQQQGLRILLLAEPMEPLSLAGLTTLPQVSLHPLALVCLSDELRPEAGEVLSQLSAQGIAFKVLSGDNPETVRATISHLDLPLAREPVVSGAELAASQDKSTLIRAHGVFGRVAPEQKVEIVQTLKDAGFHVAMIGDGVNDVLPIKRADLGIAMGEGSQASKSVSGLVLENNNFALLPETLEEGRTIVRNLRRSAKLFLVKNVYSLVLILAYASGWFGLPFPYVPQQVTLLNWLVIGIPALAIAMSRERSSAATKPRFLREVGWFALRTGVVFGLEGLAILLISARMHGAAAERFLWLFPRWLLPDPEPYQHTMLLSVLILLGITALWRALRDGEAESLVGDTRFRWLGIAAVPVYLLAMYLPPAQRFFELEPLRLVDWVVVLLVAAAGYGLSLLTDRWQLVPGKVVQIGDNRFR